MSAKSKKTGPGPKVPTPGTEGHGTYGKDDAKKDIKPPKDPNVRTG